LSEELISFVLLSQSSSNEAKGDDSKKRSDESFSEMWKNYFGMVEHRHPNAALWFSNDFVKLRESLKGSQSTTETLPHSAYLHVKLALENMQRWKELHLVFIAFSYNELND
jgi:hypothetical protein